MTYIPVALLLQLLAPQQADSDWQRAEIRWSMPRVVAEFEPQAAVLIAWAHGDEDLQLVQADIAGKLTQFVDVIIFAPHGESAGVRSTLQAEHVGLTRVRIVEVNYDTLWIRDYGPQVLVKSGRPWLLDFHYADDRSEDDAVPDMLGSLTRTPVQRVNLTIDGGNFLTNGQGVIISTQSVYHANADHWRSVEAAEQVLASQLSAREVVLLEQLVGEPTGHVDMFATFTDARTVVVAQLDHRLDPENAAILDRNASRLSQVRTASGHLRVLRVPMPPPADDVWYSYTNVLYANGTLLLPRYNVPPRYDHNAIAVFRHALPKWKIQRIDSDLLIDKAGAVHCATLNLPRVRGTTWEPLLKTNPALINAHLMRALDAPPATRVLPIPSVFLPAFVRDQQPANVPQPSVLGVNRFPISDDRPNY